MKNKKEFERWWHNEGSGYRQASHEDLEEFVNRITSVAWENGGYVENKKLEDTVKLLEYTKSVELIMTKIKGLLWN